MSRLSPLPALFLALGLVGAADAAVPAPRAPQAQSPAPAATVRARVADLLEEAGQLEGEAQNKAADEETRQALLTRALSVLGRLLAMDPHHAEARLSLGRILSGGDMGEDSLRRSVPELYRARQDDRAGALDFEIASLLGIALSRLGRFEDAVHEYDRALLLLSGQPGSPVRLRSHRATLLGNSAESLMAMGRLGDAIARYSQAELLETTDQAALHTLGLAVAYDRDGQLEKSRDAMTRSLTTDPAMKLFQSDAVFFVPAGDRHYYLALAAEAFGDRERALSSWQTFLKELPRSRYAVRARAHIDELRRTPGLSAAELLRAEVMVGAPLFPPDRQITVPGRQRSEEDIERVVLDHRVELRQCYARALRKDPRMAGELNVDLVLDRHGAVALAEVIRVSLGEGAARTDAPRGEVSGQVARDLMRCAVDTMRRWRFPPSESEHDEVALPIRFEARK